MVATLERVEGAQLPRVSYVPPGGDYALADDCLRWLREVVGFKLDPWQEMVLRESLAVGGDGEAWRATEVGLVVPRQNGKGAVLEARELVGLFRLGEALLIHSAHHFKTAQEHFLRVVSWVEEVPELKKRLKGRPKFAHGDEGITLLSGERLRIVARTRGGSGRGFSAPFMAFDEAMILPEEALGSLLFTQAAMPKRQRWYAGSAVDQFVHDKGFVFARQRERGMAGDEPRLAFFEWSVEGESPEALDPDVMLDTDVLAVSNPGYGIRISHEAIEDEFGALDARTFAVERLGLGDWPVAGNSDQVIPIEVWDARVDPRSQLVDQVCLAVDTTPDRSWTSIAAAGLNDEGAPHVEVIEHRRGTGWVATRLVELGMRHDIRRVVCGGKSAVASLEPELHDREIDLDLLSAADEARSFGLIVDLVATERLRHLGSAELRSAVQGATRRRLGDAWAWDRRNAGVDISPLVAASLALWASAAEGWDSLSGAFIY